MFYKTDFAMSNKNGVEPTTKKVAKNKDKRRRTTKEGAGRPKINLIKDGETPEAFWAKIDNWLMKGVAGTTIAARLGVHADTFYTFGNENGRWGKKTEFADFSAYKASKMAIGDDTLRERQFDSAVGMFERTKIVEVAPDGTKTERYETTVLAPPNIAMQIWLGKNRLNQTDRVDATSGDKPIEQPKGTVIVQIVQKPREDKRKANTETS